MPELNSMPTFLHASSKKHSILQIINEFLIFRSLTVVLMH